MADSSVNRSKNSYDQTHKVYSYPAKLAGASLRCDFQESTGKVANVGLACQW